MRRANSHLLLLVSRQCVLLCRAKGRRSQVVVLGLRHFLNTRVRHTEKFVQVFGLIDITIC